MAREGRLKLYGNRCHYCLEQLDAETLTRDHVIPRSRGGTRMVACCDECNYRKKDFSVEQFLWYEATYLLNKRRGIPCHVPEVDYRPRVRSRIDWEY